MKETGRLKRRRSEKRGNWRQKLRPSASAPTATPATATPGHSSSHRSGARAAGRRRPTRSTFAASARSSSSRFGGNQTTVRLWYLRIHIKEIQWWWQSQFKVIWQDWRCWCIHIRSNMAGQWILWFGEECQRMHLNAHKVDVSKWKESGETVYGGAGNFPHFLLQGWWRQQLEVCRPNWGDLRERSIWRELTFQEDPYQEHATGCLQIYCIWLWNPFLAMPMPP